MYNGVRKQKSPLKASFEPVFITKKYAWHIEINENVQNVSRGSESPFTVLHTLVFTVVQKKKNSKLSHYKPFSSVPHLI